MGATTKHEGRGLRQCLRLLGARPFRARRSPFSPGRLPRPLPTRKPRSSRPGPPRGPRPLHSHLHLSAPGSPELPVAALGSDVLRSVQCVRSAPCWSPTRTVSHPVPGPPVCPLGSSELVSAAGPPSGRLARHRSHAEGPRRRCPARPPHGPSVLLVPVPRSSPMPPSRPRPVSAPSGPFRAAESDGEVGL